MTLNLITLHIMEMTGAFEIFSKKKLNRYTQKFLPQLHSRTITFMNTKKWLLLRHLLIQSPQWKYQNMRKIFKVNNRHQNDVNMVLVPLLKTLNRFHILFWYFLCWHWKSKCRLLVFIKAFYFFARFLLLFYTVASLEYFLIVLKQEFYSV